MGLLLVLLGGLKALVKPASWVLEQVGIWAKNRAELQAASHDAKLATITAQTELAAVKIKSDLEWDLAWAGQSGNTWKDEFVLGLYSVPIILFFPALIPGPIGELWMHHYMTLIQTLQTVSPSTTW